MRAFLLTATWSTAIAVAILLVSQPISIQAQFALGVAVISVMTFILAFRITGVWRHVAMAFGVVIVLRYVYWRTTSTLPPADDLLDFIPGIVLYLGEIYCVTMLAISFFVVSDPIERKPAPADDDAALPTVDVFVPSYNEDAEILATTLSAAKLMDYPADRLNVYLLDDGGTDQKVNSPDPQVSVPAARRRAELQELCRRLDVGYLTRSQNVSAKAGNLNAGMARTNGDLIAVFDADHAPVRGFLRETVGYFLKDPKLFLVQTPHIFLNPDPVEKNLNTFNKMPSENEMFYSVIQKGLDKWNAAFFCGSAALLSRAALSEAGGFSGVSITEDCETALDLHSKGWNSVYVDKPLIAGLQPETFASFIGQRSRWCQGMLQMLLLKNPLFKTGLSGAQRISYLSSSLFWLFPVSRLIFLFSPLLYIFFSLQIYIANLQEFVSYTLAYLVVNILLQSYLYGTVRWPWVSELYEYVLSIYLAPAIASVIGNPRKPVFNVTAKGQTIEKAHLSELATPYFAIFGLLLAAECLVVYRYVQETGPTDLLLVVGIWNTFNLVIAGLGLGAVSERPERRRRQRMPVIRKAEFIVNEQSFPASIEDVSITGIRIRGIDGQIPVEQCRTGMLGGLRIEPVRKDLPSCELPVVLRRIDYGVGGQAFGLQFLHLQPIHYQIIADLMFTDNSGLSDFRQKRRTGKNVVKGSLEILGSSLHHSWRGLGFALRQLRKADDRSDTPAPAPAAPPAAAPVGAQALQSMIAERMTA